MAYHKIVKYEGREGDFIKFPEDDEDFDITAGTYYEIIWIDDDGDYVYKDDAGDYRFALTKYEEFEVYERIDE